MIYAPVKNTGDSKVSVPMDEYLRLNNRRIYPKQADEFIEFLLRKKDLNQAQRLSLKRLVIEFSAKKTKKLFGRVIKYAYFFNRIILYRYSIWIFLHELAHVLCISGYHDQVFASTLDGLYFKYIEFRREKENERRVGSVHSQRNAQVQHTPTRRIC